MSDPRLDKIEKLVTDLNEEASAIADAIDGEAEAAGNIITGLQGVNATVSDPSTSAKLDQIIADLLQTKQNLGGLRDRVKSIVPDAPSAAQAASGTSATAQGQGANKQQGVSNSGQQPQSTGQVGTSTSSGQQAVAGQQSVASGEQNTGNTQEVPENQPTQTSGQQSPSGTSSS